MLDRSAYRTWACSVVFVTSDGGRTTGESSGRGGFSAASTRRTLEVACATAGVDARGAELLRLGENAICRLRWVPLVARIARTAEYLPDIETEVAIARWLESVRLCGWRGQMCSRWWLVTGL